MNRIIFLKSSKVLIILLLLPSFLDAGYFPQLFQNQTITSLLDDNRTYVGFGAAFLTTIGGYYGLRQFLHKKQKTAMRSGLHEKFIDLLNDKDQLPTMKITEQDKESFEELIKRPDGIKQIFTYSEMDVLLDWFFETVMQDKKFTNKKKWQVEMFPKSYLMF